MEFETKSGADTVTLGRKLAEILIPPRVMILSGDLGAGKTTLVKGIATALGAAEPDEVTSPTFTLVHEYSGTQNGKPDGNPVKLLHLDLYRLDTERQLEPLGLEEMQTPDALILIEWGREIQKHQETSQRRNHHHLDRWRRPQNQPHPLLASDWSALQSESSSSVRAFGTEPMIPQSSN